MRRMSLLMKLENLSLTIPKQDRLLFSSFTTQIDKHELIMFVGESGQGKTSLLRILAKLALPTTGTVSSDLTATINSEITEWRTRFTYVAQQAIMQKGSIEDNLKLPFMLHKREYNENKAKQYMAAVGLAHLDMNHDASLCSGGEQQRIALIRALLLEPTVLLLDEVTSAIDEQNTALVEQLLVTWLAEADRAIVWISHHPKQVNRLATKVWEVKQHQITTFSQEDWLKREGQVDYELAHP